MTPDQARRILHVHRFARPDEVRSAFLAAVKSHHPDAGHDTPLDIHQLRVAKDTLLRELEHDEPGVTVVGGWAKRGR